MTAGPRLRAILTADLHDFSSRLKDDEAGALRDLQEFHARVERQVAACGGEVFRKEGDGVWCAFDSAVAEAEAVERPCCACRAPPIPMPRSSSPQARACIGRGSTGRAATR